MIAAASTCDTTLALMVQVRHDLLEMRFKEGIVMNLSGIEEINSAR